MPAGTVYDSADRRSARSRNSSTYTLAVTLRQRVVLPLPQPLAMLQARALELADTLTLGLLPDGLKLTRDQVVMLQSDNVVSEAAKAEGRTIEALGIAPTAVEAVVPGYLWRFRKAGQFATRPARPRWRRSPT